MALTACLGLPKRWAKLAEKTYRYCQKHKPTSLSTGLYLLGAELV